MKTDRCARMVWLLWAMPLVAWGSTTSPFGPSGVFAESIISDISGYGYTFDSCTSGLLALSATCPSSGSGASYGLPGESGSFTSAADLATGGLSMVGNATSGVQATGYDYLEDTLNFNGRYTNDVSTGTITMTATGTETGAQSSARIDLDLTLDYGSTQTIAIDAYTGYLPQHCFTGSFYTSCETSSADNLSVSITFPLNSSGVYLVAKIGGSAIGGTVSFEDPLTVSLPSGVTFTSQTGSFLTETVPEPGTWLLAVAGLALAIHRLRR